MSSKPDWNIPIGLGTVRQAGISPLQGTIVVIRNTGVDLSRPSMKANDCRSAESLHRSIVKQNRSKPPSTRLGFHGIGNRPSVVPTSRDKIARQSVVHLGLHVESNHTTRRTKFGPASDGCGSQQRLLDFIHGDSLVNGMDQPRFKLSPSREIGRRGKPLLSKQESPMRSELIGLGERFDQR